MAEAAGAGRAEHVEESEPGADEEAVLMVRGKDYWGGGREGGRIVAGWHYGCESGFVMLGSLSLRIFAEKARR